MGISSSAKADVSKTREDRIKTDGKQEAPKELSTAPSIPSCARTRRRAARPCS